MLAALRPACENEARMREVSSSDDCRKSFLEHVEGLKKWKEQQFQKLSQMQKSHCEKLQEEHERVDRLLRSHSVFTYKESAGTSVLAAEPKVTQQTSSKAAAIAPPADKSQPNSHKPQVESKSDNSTNNINDTAIKGLESSFEEAVQKHVQNGGSNIETCSERKPMSRPVKRPFLRKGEGLRRFQPQNVSRSKPKQKPAAEKSQPSLKERLGELRQGLQLKRPTGRKDVSSGTENQSRCVSFRDLPILNEVVDVERKREIPISNEQQKSKSSQSEKGDFEAVKEREDKELAEFERLEQATQNASFCSDSSFIQKRSDQNEAKMHPPTVSEPFKKAAELSYNFSSERHLSHKMDADRLDRYIESLRERKKIIESQLFKGSPHSSVSQKPVSQCNIQSISQPSDASACAESRSVSPDAEAVIESTDVQGTLACENVSSGSETSVSIGDADVAAVALCGPDPVLVGTEPCQAAVQDSEHGELSSSPTLDQEHEANVHQKPVKSNDDDDDLRAKLSSKLKELEEEIEIYKKYNQQLAVLNKERDELVRALEKNKEEFEKFKEEEKTKVEKEVAATRMQIRREKQTFERYQKLKNVPGRKEREECATLRQEVSSLQEQLKKQGIKLNAECKRLRKLLSAAQKERDMLKLELERAENRCTDLSSSLKILSKRKCICQIQKASEKQEKNTQDSDVSETDNDDDPVVKEIHDEFSKTCSEESVSQKSSSTTIPEKGCEEQQEESDLTHSKNPSTRPHVRFNLQPSVNSYSPEANEPEYKEVHYEDRVEKVFASGEVEVLFSTGTRKFISADKKHIKFLFFNNDAKELLPDGQIVYRYSDGTVETHHNDGLVVYEFPGGKQVERHYPNGMKKITFIDGVMHTVLPDGTEETRLEDGTVARVLPDGTQCVDYPSGEKEVRTPDYLRREFTDGTVRTVYKSGRMETYYRSGRLKVKDKDGNVVVDTKHCIPATVRIT